MAFIVFPRSADRRAGGGFGSNPTLAIRTRLADFSLSHDMGTVIGLMASGMKYRHFDVETVPRKFAGVIGRVGIERVGPVIIGTPQAERIARALQRWGYDPEAASLREVREIMDDQMARIARDTAGVGRLKIPEP